MSKPSELDLDKAAEDTLDGILGQSSTRADATAAAAAVTARAGGPSVAPLSPSGLGAMSNPAMSMMALMSDGDASPGTDQLLDDAIGSVGSPRSMPGDDEDRAFEAIVGGTAVATAVPVAAVAVAVAPAAPTAPQQQQQPQPQDYDAEDEAAEHALAITLGEKSPLARPSAADPAAFDLSASPAAAAAAAAAASVASAAAAEEDLLLGVSEEERLLQSMVAALDENGGVLGEIVADTEAVEGAIEGAMRSAVSGKSSRQKGHTVVQIKEMHAVVAELRKARAQVGAISCICAQQDNPEPGMPVSRLQLLVGTQSSLVLLFDVRQKLLGVAGTVADAKGAVTALSASADASTFVAGYERLSVILWNAETLEPIRVIAGECASTPFRLSFFRPDNSKFLSVSRDEIKFFHTGKVMGKTVFRASRLEGLFGAGGLQGPQGYRGGLMADAATATLPDPVAPAGSDLLRFYYAVTTQTELLVGAVQFGLTSTNMTVDFRRAIRGPAAGAQAAAANLAAAPAGGAAASGLPNAASRASLASGSSSSSGFAASGGGATSASFASQQQSGYTAGALVAWRKKTRMSLSLFLTDACMFEVYALIQTQNDASVSVVQLNRMEMPLPMRTLNCLDAGCALLGDVHDNLHVVDPAMGVIIESVQSSAGFDMIRRGGFPANVHGSYTDGGGATFFCSADRVALCTVLSWEARIEALIFLKRWHEALQLAQQFACSEDVTAVGLVDASGNRNTDQVKQYAESTLLPALLADGLRNPRAFRKLLDRTMDFCHATGLLRNCLQQMLMFCKTIDVEPDFYFALENLLLHRDCSGIPDQILMSLVHFFVSRHEEDERRRQEKGGSGTETGATAAVPTAKKSPAPKQGEKPRARSGSRSEGSAVSSSSSSSSSNSGDSSSSSSDDDDGDGLDEEARREAMLSRMTMLQRLERCLQHILGMDELILKLAKQYKLWHAVMVIWSLRRQRPDVVIIELSGVADDALVHYVATVVDGFAPDGETPVDNAVDARRRVVTVLQGQPSVLRRIAAIPGFLDVVRRAMRIENVWKVDLNAPRYHSGGSNAAPPMPCNKTEFLSKLDTAIEAVAQPQLTSAFLLMWAEQVSIGEATVGEPETFFARVLQNCLPSSSSSSSASRAQVAAAREALQVTLCNALLYSPAFAAAKLPELERTLVRGGGANHLPRLLATIMLRLHRFKDAIDVFFDPRYAPPAPPLSATIGSHHHHHHHHNQHHHVHSGVGDVFAFFETALAMFERERTPRAKEQFAQVVKDSIPRLIAVNSSKLARFVSSHLNELQPFVLKALPADSREQCEFLKEFLDRLNAQAAAGGGSGGHNRVALQTRLLKLMCQFDPDNLYSYLVERDATIEFEIEPVLRAAQQHNIIEACAFLYEKTCQIFEAMKLLIRALDRSVADFWAEEQKRIAAIYRQHASDDAGEAASGAAPPVFKLAAFDSEYESLAALVTSTFTAVRDLDGAAADDPSSSIKGNHHHHHHHHHRHRGASVADVPSNGSISSSTSSFVAATAAATAAAGGRGRGMSTANSNHKDGHHGSATLATIERLLTAGIGLCRRHATKIDPNELRNAWFTLLDLFAKPKRQFQKRLDAWRMGSSGGGAKNRGGGGLKRQTSSLAMQRSSDGSGNKFDELSPTASGVVAAGEPAQLSATTTAQDFPEMKDGSGSGNASINASVANGVVLSAGGVRFHMTMLKFFVEHSTVILAHMVQELDLKEVIEKIVNDSDEESYASLKPVIVGILDLLRFELTSNDLCRKCACHDVVHLSNELHTMLAGAMPLHGVFCWLCQSHLRRHGSDTDNMRVFRCGHGFHERCIAGQAECPQCIASAGASSALDAEMMRRMQQHNSAAAAGSGAGGGAGGGDGKKKAAADQDDDDRDDLLDPARCLRRLGHVRRKLDAAKNRRMPLLLSPLPRAPSIPEQEAPMQTRPQRVMDLTATKMLPASAYRRRGLPSHLAAAAAASAPAAAGGGGGDGDLDW